MTRGADLRLAARSGLLLLPVPGLGRVELHGDVLRYDPAIRPEQRAREVTTLLRDRAQPASPRKSA